MAECDSGGVEAEDSQRGRGGGGWRGKQFTAALVDTEELVELLGDCIPLDKEDDDSEEGEDGMGRQQPQQGERADQAPKYPGYQSTRYTCTRVPVPGYPVPGNGYPVVW